MEVTLISKFYFFQIMSEQQMVSLNGKGSLHHLANARVTFFSHSATLGDDP